MRRLNLNSAAGFSTVLVLVVLKLNVLLFYERTHAFSPSLSTPLQYNPTSKIKQGLSRLGVAGSSASDDQTSEFYPILYDPSFVRFRCRIAYDGTSFGGFQLQGGREGKAKKPKQIDESSLTKEQLKHKRKSEKNINPRTIQGELEKVLSKRFRRLVKVIGAGRTDVGVHANGQAIHFDLYHNETTTKNKNSSSSLNNNTNDSFEQSLELTIGRMLPSDICAWNLCRASPNLVKDTGSNYTPPGWYNWNAIRSSTGKLYSYRICIRDSMHPSDRYQRWQLPRQSVDATNLNTTKLKAILQKFQGTHNFVCFAGALEQQEKKMGFAMNTVRNIQNIDLVQEKTDKGHNNGMGGDPSEHYYRIDIYLDGALYKMVRNIVGTAIDASLGWLDEERLDDLLNKPSELGYARKNNPCKPAPSNGLTLERVFYHDEPGF